MDLNKKLDMALLFANRANGLQLYHVLQGVDGYAEFVFPYVRDKMEVREGRIVDGEWMSAMLFKALKKRSVMLVEDHLAKLLTKRDETNDEMELAELDVDVTRLTQMVEDYEGYFDVEDYKTFQRCLLSRLNKWLATREPSPKRHRTE